MATTSPHLGAAIDPDVATELNPGSAGPAVATAVGQPTMTSLMAAPGATRLEQPIQQWRLPVLGHLPVARQIRALSVVLVGCLIAAAGVVYYYARSADQLALSVSTSTTMQMLSQRMAKAAQQAVLGDAAGFAQLEESRSGFAAELERLSAAAPGLAPAAGRGAQALEEVATRWEPVAANADLILAQREGLLELRTAEATIAEAAPSIERLTGQLAALVGSSQEAYRARTLALQLAYDVRNYGFMEAVRLLSTEEPNPRVALQLGRNVTSFGDQLQALLGTDGATGAVRGEEARRTAERLGEEFAPFAASVRAILADMTELAAAKQASRDIFAASEPLLQTLRVLASSFAERSVRQLVLVVLASVLGLVALICVALVAKVFLEDARARAAQSDRDYRRNQEAIIRLLDEMQGLAEGNLTIQARVTDDITGAIADSVYFAVEELRALVTGINQATASLGGATGETRQISTRVLLAASRQTKEIRRTTATVLDMARSIKQVSDRAEECVAVAQRSLAASEKGATAVQASISGMNAIREQIQETAKPIKRLGESSQEIGEIVELIADITEQTNVLALNAAIQAASAGAAGRGFSVVAEEVQRLAERSAEATQQIAAIVKTIQTDTQDTVLAMEKSTQGVVEGARLSDAAGRGLAEIGAVSRQLAEMIHGISKQTSGQAAGAQGAARSMHDILKITEQTAAGTKRANLAMEKVSALAQGLARSVSGFRV